MSVPRFVQIHTLVPFAASRLNSDESGQSKKMPYGGAVRTRIASQALKRWWREADDRYALKNIGMPQGYRSRVAVERRITNGLSASTEKSREVVAEMTKAFSHGLYGKRADTVRGRQPLMLGEPELEFLKGHAERIYDAHPEDAEKAKLEVEVLFDGKGAKHSNLRAFRESSRLAAGVESAMFGRMVTSDTTANIDGAIHVAHALTVHREESEIDFFTVVDDLMAADESGTAHVGESELTAGLYYGYVVVDVPMLVSNTEGRPASEWKEADREMAALITKYLTHLIATVSPGANKGSTAPYAYAEFMMLEVGDRQPRSLASAFRNPVRAHVDDAVDALAAHLAKMDRIYGSDEGRRYLSLSEAPIPRAELLNLNDLAEWVARTIRSLEVE